MHCMWRRLYSDCVLLCVIIGDELTCCGRTRLPFSNLTVLATKVFAVAFRGLCAG
jgi:hypothetical protein